MEEDSAAAAGGAATSDADGPACTAASLFPFSVVAALPGEMDGPGAAAVDVDAVLASMSKSRSSVGDSKWEVEEDEDEEAEEEAAAAGCDCEVAGERSEEAEVRSGSSLVIGCTGAESCFSRCPVDCFSSAELFARERLQSPLAAV